MIQSSSWCGGNPSAPHLQSLVIFPDRCGYHSLNMGPLCITYKIIQTTTAILITTSQEQIKQDPANENHLQSKKGKGRVAGGICCSCRSNIHMRRCLIQLVYFSSLKRLLRFGICVQVEVIFLHRPFAAGLGLDQTQRTAEIHMYVM